MQALPFASLAIIFYLGAGLWQGLTLTRRVPARTRLVRSLALIAVACHAVIVWVTLNHGGALHLGLFESASLVSWAICLLLVIASLFKPVIAGGAALFPVAAACVLGVMNLPSATTENPLSPGLVAHIFTSVAALAFSSIAAMQAGLLSLQQHALKKRHTRGIVQVLPALTSMERALFELIWAGMILLSVSIISGTIYLDNMFAQHLAHKTVLSLGAWIIFAVLLFGHHVLGWRGQRAARWTLGGCLVLALAFFGTKFVLQVVFSH
ncbi:cytochrome C assembly family protein [Cobetia sp. UCD-24C]|uniref:cytochrome C assembly family protein n=1 Tax=Cobetia sp. UCD-24C TaxID=1716176 RepID=UPI0006CA0894|nr:cytochrome c biogenesis protein CcsA [Cobetia sp. UCD-24C]KPM75110.1 cytochrome C biogenesis protein [Cobetia sp. UCD-24C]